MMISLNERLRKAREEEGFTLIELMVVVLIIGILIAIAIPTFLGARGRAQDRAVQSNLRNALTNAKAIYTDKEDYSTATDTALATAEPSLRFVPNTDSTDPAQVSVDPGTSPSTVWVGAAQSKNNSQCWFITDRVNPSSSPGTWWAYASATTTHCKPASLPASPTFATASEAGKTWYKAPGDAKDNPF